MTPEISQEEYKEYMELKRKQIIRDKAISNIRTLRPQDFPQLKKKPTIRLYAATFAKVLKQITRKEEEYLKKQGVNQRVKILSFSWEAFKNYVGSECLKERGGRIYIKDQFRNLLKEYGYKMKMNRRIGTIQVEKI